MRKEQTERLLAVLRSSGSATSRPMSVTLFNISDTSKKSYWGFACATSKMPIGLPAGVFLICEAAQHSAYLHQRKSKQIKAPPVSRILNAGLAF